VFSLSKKLKLNLNSRLVVIFVLRLAKQLSETAKRNRSAKVSHAVYRWTITLRFILSICPGN